jgi:hypothetical protein
VFAGTSQRVNGAIVPFPIEIRIERRGDVFTGSARAASDEDAAWIVVGSATLKDFSMEGSGALPLAGVFATAAISSATPTFTALTAEVCDLELIEPTEPPRFHRGDPNASGTTDISDGVDIFGFLFLGGTVPTCRESADVNNNGEIDLTDGISLLNWLFLGGPPPAAPGPTTADCGVDPDEPGSPGDLSCEAYAPCS